MQSAAATPDQYYANLPEDRKEAMMQLRKVMKKNLPKGFQEVMNYGMPGFVVPHKLYPAGYHCKPEDPLPFISLASQKNSINFYHMGIYSEPKLLKWFTSEFPKHSKKKLDMGKSCVRFKKPEDIPLDLIGELVSKMTPQDWIALYEKNLKR
jgi:hypothetical protein